MSRSMLIFSLVAELLVSGVAFAKPRNTAKCLANCDAMQKKFEKSCKSQMPSGKCDGRGKALVDDLDKRCREECTATKKKK